MKIEEIKQWAFSIIDASSFEFDTLLTKLPQSQRDVVGELKKWSSKDQIAHLIYWIDLFVANMRACLKGFDVVSTANYLVMNDAAWQERKDWTWLDVKTNTAQMFSNLRTQIQEMRSEDLIDATRYSLEKTETGPKSLLQSLVYELIDHPTHHFVRMYQTFKDREGIDSLLVRMLQVTNQPSILIWSEITLKKIQELIEQNRTA